MDKTLPKIITGDSSIRLDKWWSVIFTTGKYPALSAVVKACLSIFTGPQVESSLSIMNDIIKKKSGRMLTETYSAIIGTKYLEKRLLNYFIGKAFSEILSTQIENFTK